MTTTIQQLSEILQTVFIHDAKEIGRSSGFIQRERKLNGASFAQSLIFGWQANPEASLEDLCQSAGVCGVQISPQGMQERLNSPEANTFLYQLLMRALGYVVEAQGERRDLLAQFNGVYIQDSSKIELPTLFEQQWQDNNRGQASLKVQTLYDYQQGRLGMTFVAGRRHDCPLQTVALPVGSLRLADIGYFKVAVFEQLNAGGVFWVSRVPARAGFWTGEQVIHLATWLQQAQSDTLDQVIELTAQRLKCRLIAFRVPDAVTDQRADRVRAEAKDRTNTQLKPETLALCQWTILITNLDANQATVNQILCLLRLRWQIELLFKLWKDELSLDAWRSQQPHRILSEVYAKLLLALFQHWLFVLSCWDTPNRSLVKASRLLRKHAFHILTALSHLKTLCRCLQSILPTLNRCRVQKRKARPAAFQLLAHAFP
jgi:DDE family transposase